MTQEKRKRIASFIILTILYGLWIALSIYWFNWKLAVVIYIALTAYGYESKIKGRFK